MTFPVCVAERRFPALGHRGPHRSLQQQVPAPARSTRPARPSTRGCRASTRSCAGLPDGTRSVIDLDSPNGIQVNGKDVPSGTPIPVRPGDQIHLGAWTLITLISAIV